MDIEVILLFSVFAIIILLVLAIFVFLLYMLWKVQKFGKILSFSLLGFIFYIIYTAIYPSESFYRNEFESNMGFKLSNSIKFLEKKASYPDFHGDYYSTATMEVSKDDYKKISQKISVTINNDCNISNYMHQYNLKPLSCLLIKKNLDKNFELIIFSDKKTIYFSYNQT